MHTVTLWTIQPAGLLRQVRTRGHARVDRTRRPDVPERYRWLVRQLRRRIPGYRGALPWWFYCRRPDLRRHRWRWPVGEKMVLLEVEVDADRVIAFPSWAWHDVFCGEFLARSAREYRGWRAALRRAVPDEDLWPLPPRWRRLLERSWERLFGEVPERAWAGYGRVLGWSPEGREAVLETIRAEDIREATLFRGASRDPVLLAFHRFKGRRIARRRHARSSLDRRAAPRPRPGPRSTGAATRHARRITAARREGADPLQYRPSSGSGIFGVGHRR